ncbi:hypothetical protein OIE68_46095 [Nocardia vinacea]|uniref:hypothetical protein n=1 Tax=Nocardia vinacea TaxID=96468 RepID=UPI002E140F1B|nr:hypothetical protein OIE68_46095 [Nocardia vinacea]
MTTARPATAFLHLTAVQAGQRRDVVEDIYRRSYVEAIASGDPFDSPEQFMHRFDAHTDPLRSRGFELVTASIDGKTGRTNLGLAATAEPRLVAQNPSMHVTDSDEGQRFLIRRGNCLP